MADETPEPEGVQGPSPLMTTFNINPTPTGSHVILSTATAQGLNYFFLEADTAEAVGKLLIEQAEVARKTLAQTLVVAKSPLLGPQGQVLSIPGQ